jgi:hypothetical protein
MYRGKDGFEADKIGPIGKYFYPTILKAAFYQRFGL